MITCFFRPLCQIAEWYFLSLFGVVLLLMIGACESPPPEPTPPPPPKPYSFFVAGHAYGNPYGYDTLPPGLFPPFVAQFPYILQHSDMRLGVLTGDVVKRSTEENWLGVIRNLAAFDFPVYIAPGNHDNWGEPWYKLIFNSPGVYVRQERDLFLFLDPDDEGWNIPQTQLDFVDTLLKQPDLYRNIFVFVHQVLWYDPVPKGVFQATTPNNITDRDSTLNFKETLDAKLRAIPNPVWLFAGDVGAWCTGREATIHSEGKMHYITSGMGCESRSNFLIVQVDTAGALDIEVVWLDQDDRHQLGGLEEYRY